MVKLFMKRGDEIWTKSQRHHKFLISNKGNVIGARGRLLNPSYNNSGYSYVKIGYEVLSVHQLVAEEFIPNSFNLKEIDHIDSNKSNNHSTNLQWISRLDNMRKWRSKDGR